MNQTYLYLIKFYKSVLFIYLLLFTGQKLKTWWKCKILRDKCHKSDLISLTCNLKNLKMGKFCQLAHYTLFFCEYNSSSFFFLLFVSSDLVGGSFATITSWKPWNHLPLHTQTFHGTRSLSCWKSSKIKDLQCAKIKSHDYFRIYLSK